MANIDIEPHKWVHTPKRKGCTYPWAICDHCGLVRLKNKSTDLAVKLGCGWKEHPTYLAFARRQEPTTLRMSE